MRRAPELHTPTLSRNHHLRVGSPADEIYEKSTDLGRGSNHSDPEGRLLVILTIRHADHLLSSRQRPRGRTSGRTPKERKQLKCIAELQQSVDCELPHLFAPHGLSTHSSPAAAVSRPCPAAVWGWWWCLRWVALFP